VTHELQIGYHKTSTESQITSPIGDKPNHHTACMAALVHSARDQVFAITELLELILESLQKQMLYRVLRVNRRFRAVVKGSDRLLGIMNLKHSTRYSFDDLIPNHLHSSSNPSPRICLERWTDLPGDMVPLRYVLLTRPNCFEIRIRFRPFCFRMVELDCQTKSASVIFDLKVPGSEATPDSEIGLVGRRRVLHLYSSNQEASWAGNTLFSMAMPVTVVVNARVAFDSPVEMDYVVKTNCRRRKNRYGNGFQQIRRVFRAEEATVGSLFALLEEILAEVRSARRRAGRMA